jgi:hypothetical protein
VEDEERHRGQRGEHFFRQSFQKRLELESDKTWLHAALGVWDPPSCMLLDNAVDTICGDLPRAPTAGRGAPTTR